MYTHAPPDYICPFYLLVQGIENTNTQLKHTDIVYQTADTTAFMATRKWPDNQGHVLIVPNEHYENIYDLPISLGTKIFSLNKNIALAMKSEYMCDGVMLRQHNEPAGDQHIWHFHLHIIPRYQNDDFHNTQKKIFAAGDRAEYALKLRNWFSSNRVIMYSD